MLTDGEKGGEDGARVLFWHLRTLAVPKMYLQNYVKTFCKLVSDVKNPYLYYVPKKEGPQ